MTHRLATNITLQTTDGDKLRQHCKHKRDRQYGRL